MPAVPRVLLDLIQATREPSVNIDELTKIISQDTGLSAKIIATANSPFYRRTTEVNDLNRILILLGLSTLKTIAITKAVQQFFSQLSHAQQNFLELIWYRSLNCALLAKKIASLIAYDAADEAYLTGLLHRIGQLVLLDCFPKEYAELLDTQNELTIENGEKKLFGANHYEIGAFFNRKLAIAIIDCRCRVIPTSKRRRD
ncbi:HDOD domain-containing protein [Methylocucumis oryzae]|uniref:HDOD domain-containing protein n=1 Tax=Methylocucumis oryzae TaxID=1632867 RepID=UPI00195523A0|nr:HDOD domain-containing protein [Methylocucumis oryzae]